MKHALDPSATNVSHITSVQLAGAVFDDMLITHDVEYGYTQVISSQWDFNTVLHALFENNLFAGNIAHSADQISLVRIKRRRKGSFQWVTLFEVPITSKEDFNFDRFDRFAGYGEYEYCLVPVINGIEGNININSINSTFDGIYIVDKESAFGTSFEASLNSVERVKPTSLIQVVNGRFPYVVSNGATNYDQGTFSGVFVEIDKQACKWDFENSGAYRQRATDFFSNGKPKLLKTDDGHCWIIRIVDNVTNTANEHEMKVTTSANWVAVGDSESSNDLYHNNLIDINLEGV